MASAPTLRERALALLARREHSRAQLARKLAAHARDGDELAAVLDELESRGWLSDARFAEALIHDKQARFGSAYLVQALRRQGVPEELVREYVGALRQTEEERARQVWRAKFGVLPGDARERARQMRFLAQRGFAMEVIARILCAPCED